MEPGEIAGVVEPLADVARRRSVDGIICGHIHHAADRMIDGVHYLNCGDWVESCTAIVETQSGEMRLVRWGHPASRPAVAKTAAVAARAAA